MRREIVKETERLRKGLDGVLADETAVSEVEPERSFLSYRGYSAEDLAERCSFEEVAYAMWRGSLPTSVECEEFCKEERARRAAPRSVLEAIGRFPRTAHPMDMTRTALSMYGMEDADAGNIEAEALADKAMGLFAVTPTLVAAIARHRKGLEAIAPRDDLSFSRNMFHMTFGEEVEEGLVEAFDVSMTLYAEHSFNASTFTARTISSSLSDMYSAVVGAVGSLKGRLHGGANEAVMEVLQEIGDVSRVGSWLDKALEEKRTVMGFGHRVYKYGDSRVPKMTEAFHKTAALSDGEKWVDLSSKLAEEFVARKGIHPNLDYPAGPTYYLMGFDVPMYTPLFVMSRMTGWTAHVMEQLGSNRLVRPLSVYVGERGREVVGLSKRG